MSAVSGCASLPKCGDLVVDDESAGRLVVYRKRALMGFGAALNVAVDECKLGTLWNGGYIVGKFPAGEHQISLLSEFGNPIDPHTIHVASGSDTYVRWSEVVEDVIITGSTGIATGHTVFTEVLRETAISELEKLRELE